jgi:DNA replication initiation complex subunit (GINS family)
MDKFSKVRSSLKDIQKKLALRNSKKTPQELDEHERFEDDPRALKEIEYGRVVRKPTTPLSGGSTLGTIEFEDKKWQ